MSRKIITAVAVILSCALATSTCGHNKVEYSQVHVTQVAS